MVEKVQEDIVLIRNILNGNLKAEETLYNKYKKIITDFLKSKYSLYYDLDDDVSEILIKVFISLENYNIEKSNFKSWVFSIAKNYMIDKWRCNSVNLLNENISSSYSISADTLENTCTYITPNSIFPVNTTSFTTTNYSNEFENCSSINFISQQLSPTDYTLLDMKYIQGYNYNEIGMEFNVTSSTVSNRVNYLKSKLKKNNPEIIYD